MLRDPFTKALWDARRSLLGWAIGIGATALLYAAFFPSFRNPAMSKAMENYPESLKKALNMQDITSPAGYLGSYIFGLLLPMLLAVFAIIMGARVVAGDEEAGILDLLLAHPVGRTRFAASRLAAIVVDVLIISAVTLIALLAISGPAKLSSVGAGNLAAATLHMAALGISFAALALAVGAATGRRAATIGATTVVAVLGYFGNNLAPQVHSLAWARRLSPFYYNSAGDPLRHGLQWPGLTVLLVTSIILAVLGLLAFDRRDIAT